MASVRIYPTIAAAIQNAHHVAANPLRFDPTSHLLSRFAFGPTTADRADVAEYGPDGWYARQVRYVGTYSGYRGDAKVEAFGPLLKLSPYDLRQWLINNGNEYGWDAMDQLTQVTLGLQCWSRAQLYETLVDFFANHLNVPNHNGDMWITRACYDRDVIRKHVGGSFTNMLLASAKHPAMLQYLNLAESTKVAVNENYGRELLELHTVGLHYSERDVQNAARLLTGRTIDDNQHYLFDDYIHATGRVTVLQFTDPNTDPTKGEAAGDRLLRYLAAHKYTALHLAQKLCVRFVSDAPSSTLVNAVAKAYLVNKTQILPMVSTILRSTEFWESRGRKVRRPAENLVATIRALDAKPSNLSKILGALHWVSYNMGNVPLDWPAPNGYPDVAAAWRSSGTLLRLWDAHLSLSGGWWGGLSPVDLTAHYAHAKTSGEAVAGLAKGLTGSAFSSTHLRVLQAFLNEPATTPIGNSVLKWWTVPLAAVILDGPHHALR